MASAALEDSEKAKEEALKICQEFLGDIWCDLSLSEFRFSAVTEGLNNAKYRCALPDKAVVKNLKTPRQVLLRFYGPLQEDENDIVKEVATFILLAERNLGPKLYGVFPNGRLEQFIPSRTLTSKDYKVMYPSIAREMAKLHSLDVPVRKIPDHLTNVMKKWINEVKTDTKPKTNSTLEYLDIYTEETEWLEKIMKKSNSPVVFCHNDLLGGNILYGEDSPSEGDPRLTFVDIEFGAYNYRGFDIANHFTEWCFDYCIDEYPYFEYSSEKLPTKDQQIAFIRAYLDQLVEEGAILTTSVEVELKSILQEIDIFMMAANLLWSLWGWKMSCISVNKFGVKEFSNIRMDDFRSTKKKYLNHMIKSVK